MAVYNNIMETIGGTPLVRLNRLTEGKGATVLAKVESFNPANSVKDRIGKAIVEAAEKSGQLLSLIHISEPTRREWLSRMPSSA